MALGAREKGKRMEGGGRESKLKSEDEGSELMNGDVGDGLRRRRTRKIEDETRPDTKDDRDGGESRFKWQKLPPTLWHRADWVMDLVTNFRGVRWSHQISHLPFPDVSSPSAFAEPISHQSSTVTNSSSPSPYPTRSALLRYNLVSFFVTFIAIDIIKLIMLKDPYYWGLPNLSSSPSPFPFPRTVHMYLSLATLFTSLNMIFVCAPIVFSYCAGERFLGEHAWPWLYPPLFGPMEKLWTHGLAGFWGGWWHPMFRLAFEQLGEAIVTPLGWEKKTVTGGFLRVLLAFMASGTLHACGSYTSLGETHPLHEFLFFAVQPVGILTQRALIQWMKTNGLRDQVPAAVRGVANLAFVMAWFWLTAPTVADDFTRSGVWLYEPFPISPSRGLAGDGWWRWGGTWCRWHSDEKWWKSGLAF